MRFTTITLSILIMFNLTGCNSAGEKDNSSLYSKENLVAWCIVPFDASERTPLQRAEMLVDLGITQFAYDYRDKHIPSFKEEIRVMEAHGIDGVEDHWQFGLNFCRHRGRPRAPHHLHDHEVRLCSFDGGGHGAACRPAVIQPFLEREPGKAGYQQPLRLREEAARKGLQICRDAPGRLRFRFGANQRHIVFAKSVEPLDGSYLVAAPRWQRVPAGDEQDSHQVE